MRAIREIRRAIDHKITIDLPRSFQDEEVEIIILPLKKLHAVECESTLLSENSLGKDWNKTEEDNAWKNL